MEEVYNQSRIVYLSDRCLGTIEGGTPVGQRV